MSGYAAFAPYYDSLMRNVDYQGRADYLMSLFQRYEHAPGLTLDLACGTGTLTVELAKRGVDIYGIDSSPAMLAQARDKALDAGLNILFLCQKMQNIDLYGTVNTVLCTMDSINHLVDPKEVEETFQRVSLFLEPKGYFIFDMNTLYKHRKIIGNHTFVYDAENVFCVWQNTLDEKKNRISVSLDFFERTNSLYRRTRTHFYETAYSVETIKKMAEQAGLQVVDMLDDMSLNSPQETSQRIVVVVRKPEK